LASSGRRIGRGSSGTVPWTGLDRVLSGVHDEMMGESNFVVPVGSNLTMQG
jgi:hypothetical protein